MASSACRIGILATAVSAAVATAACGGSARNKPPAAAPTSAGIENDDAAAGLLEHHRYHHHGGVTLFIAMSLDTLGISPEQRAAVEKIRTELHARMDAAGTAEQNLEATLADGVAAAHIDTAKVDAGIAQLTAAAEAVHDASRDALNKLHDELAPPQRAALVDKVESHWAVWKKANAEESGGAEDGGHLATLVMELGLTQDQVDRIRSDLREAMKPVPRVDPQEIATHLHAFGDAFRSDTFDAKALATASSANAHLVSWGAAHMARLVETASPVLTPDQRAKLAQMLREHAAHNPSAQGRP